RPSAPRAPESRSPYRRRGRSALRTRVAGEGRPPGSPRFLHIGIFVHQVSQRSSKLASLVRFLNLVRGFRTAADGRRSSRLSRVESTEELGRGGRLRGEAAGELVAAAYAAESAHGARLARGLSLADLAHAVALAEGGDLAGDEARSLLC